MGKSFDTTDEEIEVDAISDVQRELLILESKSKRDAVSKVLAEFKISFNLELNRLEISFKPVTPVYKSQDFF